MNLLNIIIIGIALAADASAVISAKATSFKTNVNQKIIILAFSFAVFQAAMPIIGYFIGLPIIKRIQGLTNIVACVILVIIGLNMIKEAKDDSEEISTEDKLSIKTIISLSIATSIDALICGISFIALKINIFYASAIVFITTLICCLLAGFFGKYLQNKFSSHAELVGGIILIIIGIKFLI